LAALQEEPAGDRVAQELLSDPSQEFTCALFRAGDPASVRTIVFRRVLVGGLTGRARVEEVPAITALLCLVAEAAELTGSINVQLRLTRAGPRIFEINPRFSSTVMMRHRLGFQDVVWALNHRATRQVPPPFASPVGTRIFRLGREVVVPAAAPA
jgi:carbamoyl-phosphate synthase large subunit